MASKSMEMGEAANISSAKLFLKSQFCTKPKRAPAGTDLSRQVAIITGASTGLGLRCARHLLSLKLSRLIMAVRSPEKGEAVANTLRAQYPSAQIDVWALEMTSYPSIQAFAQRAEKDLERLDIAILNAAIVLPTFITCPSTGHDQVIQVNFLSTFLLGILLLPVLKHKAPAKTPGRLTIVSSGVACFAALPNRNERPLLASFDDLNIQPWDASERYAASKLLGHLFLVRMLEYLNSDDVIVNLADPGYCKGTDLHRDTNGVLGQLISVSKAMTGREPDDGAWAYVDAAIVKDKTSHGCFCMDWEIRPFAKIVYEPEGRSVIDAVWNETLAELEFAGVREILEKSKKRQL